MQIDIETFYNTDERKRLFFPGRVLLGPGAAHDAVDLLRQAGFVAVVVDRAFERSELYSQVLGALSRARIETLTVHGMPVTQEVMAFAQSLPGVPAAVLSIGGGSATDTAKATIAWLLFGELDGVGLGPKAQAKAVRPKPLFVAVPTTGGSGAEASRYYVTYDRVSRAKVFGRSWSLVADWILLDPRLLDCMPADILTISAFDSFVHFFESFVCQHERSCFGDMLSLHGMAGVMSAVDRAVRQGIRDDATHAELLQCGTLGGIAISNIRTGNIHEAAGALLEHTDLTHGETLFVFFRRAIEQYRTSIGERELLLLRHLRAAPRFEALRSMDDVIAWWEGVFDATGITGRIRRTLSACRPRVAVLQRHIGERLMADKVWISKESPVTLSEAMVRDLTEQSLRDFGID